MEGVMMSLLRSKGWPIPVPGTFEVAGHRNTDWTDELRFGQHTHGVRSSAEWRGESVDPDATSSTSKCPARRASAAA